VRPASTIYAPAVRSLQQRIAGSETAKAAGLAVAALAANAVAVVVTVVFTRLLGDEDYGALAALMSTFTILAVAGSSLQVAVARDTALGRLGGAASAAKALRAWTRTLLVVLVGVVVASALMREGIASLVGVSEEPWAAACVPPTGVLWLLLSLQRGVLQGLGAYAPVGWSVVSEAVGRLVAGCLLVVVGAGVVGAYLGTPLAMAATSLALARVLHRRAAEDRSPVVTARAHELRTLVVAGWAPIVGLLLLAALQNVDVIMAKREMTASDAGAYAAAVVAAKLVVWVAIGIGLHLLPEATRRATAGIDPRPVLLRALGLLAIVAVPSLIIFTIAPETLLRVAFGEEFVTAADALPILGLAMTLLAVSTLAVQYMLALHRTAFLWALAVAAIAEPLLLSGGDPGMRSFAEIVLAVQAAAAVACLGLAARARPAQAVAMAAPERWERIADAPDPQPVRD
jgi:O-antigen/teichoic acid export membrane protein